MAARTASDGAMTRLRAATERLAHAVARLENAVENRAAAGASDRESLEQALAAARRERDALDAQRQDVAARLDNAITRLSAVLGEDTAATLASSDESDAAAGHDLVAAAQRAPDQDASSG